MSKECGLLEAVGAFDVIAMDLLPQLLLLWIRAARVGHRCVRHSNSVSRDGRQVVFVSVAGDGRSAVWLATLDASAPPRRLISLDTIVRALLDPAGGVYFVGGSPGSLHLHHIKEDGTGLRRVVPQPIMFLYAVSPGGEAIAVWEGAGAEWLHPGDMPGTGGAPSRARGLGDVSVYSRDGSTRTLVCTGCATAGGPTRHNAADRELVS